MAAKKLTRREIVQEDKIRTSLTTIYGWLMRHLKILVAVLTVVIAAVAGAYFWRNYQASQSLELQAQFGEALKTYHAAVLEQSPAPPTDPAAAADSSEDPASPEGEPAPDSAAEPAAPPEDPSKPSFRTAQERDEAALKAFEKIAQDAPRTRLGRLSLYYVSLIQARRGEAETAQSNLEKVLQESEAPEIRNLIRNSLAQMALEAQDHQRAIDLYNQILNESSPTFPKQTVLMSLARSHEAKGNLEEAIKAYKQITTDYPTSELAREAQTEITRLEALQPPEGAQAAGSSVVAEQ